MNFKCRTCGGDSVIHIGSVMRGYISDNALAMEPVTLYACGQCSATFYNPSAYSEWDDDQPQSIDDCAGGVEESISS